MRLILSRKGFDSSAGGCPSPVFPDGTFISLPIPDRQSPICYEALQHPVHDMGKLISDLTSGRIAPDSTAHLDPDLIGATLDRAHGWRPLLGQAGAAQSHLRRQGVREGDIFLFFGLFREADKQNGRYRFLPQSRPFHAIWGWLQVGEISALADPLSAPQWMHYHPHCHGQRRHNTLYIGSEKTQLARKAIAPFGGSAFPFLNESQRLTERNAALISKWRLPGFFYPQENRRPLSYHGNLSRWRRDDSGPWCLLQAAARGQEFVLQAEDYPEAEEWIADFIGANASIGSEPPPLVRSAVRDS